MVRGSRFVVGGQTEREVQARLARAREEIRVGVEAAVAECAAQIAQQARADCPVRSGRLRDSIGIEVAADPQAGIIEGRVFADAPYAAAVELGRGKSAPQPFLFPALETQGPRLVTALRRRRDM